MPYPFQIQTRSDYDLQYAKSIEDPIGFWSEIASHFKFSKKWDQVLSWNFKEPRIKWFEGAKLNITENCIDRHLESKMDQPAIIWEANDPLENKRIITYKELHQTVCEFAAVLKRHGVQKGDRVCIYMGMIPELVIAMLACARIGAIHNVVFGGFSAQSLIDRIQDAQVSCIISCDGAFRGSKTIELKAIVDEALLQCPTVKTQIVYQRTHSKINMLEGRDFWWHEELTKINSLHSVSTAPEPMDAEDMLFILYTSGSTGKPKGVVHTCAGYMIYTCYSFVNVFQYKEKQIHFCTADIGWITGHSYIVYGPLCAGATTLLYEGIPTWPDPGRLWDIIDKYQVNILYTAPTAIRSLMSFGETWFENKKLDSLKVLGSVGEPINEEAWEWYSEHVGHSNCPIVDTWWQTETGGILISNLAGVTPQKPSFATLPLPGIQACLVTDDGQEISEHEIDGFLCIKFPWPGMLRTTYGDHERFRKNYFDRFEDLYFSGDGAKRDENGLYRITGRVDDVLKISGHRIGTAEVENAVNSLEDVTESAVVGYPHPIKGQAIYAFVIYNGTNSNYEQLKAGINEHIQTHIGPIAKADKIQIVKGLPKTRSGKIMRRILRKIACGELHELRDTSTLLDPGVVDEIIANRII
ncbi:MAG TPA: acetate--CoA ligase [Saprospiraceae bacterium]|nr:acetate--CoA ligase [Saprospiraceae bacterium]